MYKNIIQETVYLRRYIEDIKGTINKIEGVVCNVDYTDNEAKLNNWGIYAVLYISNIYNDNVIELFFELGSSQDKYFLSLNGLAERNFFFDIVEFENCEINDTTIKSLLSYLIQAICNNLKYEVYIQDKLVETGNVDITIENQEDALLFAKHSLKIPLNNRFDEKDYKINCGVKVFSENFAREYICNNYDVIKIVSFLKGIEYQIKR